LTLQSIEGEGKLKRDVPRTKAPAEGKDNPALTKELAAFKTGVAAGVAAEVAGFKTGVQAELAGFKTGVHAELAGFKTGVEAELRRLTTLVAELQRTSAKLSDVCAHSAAAATLAPLPSAPSMTPDPADEFWKQQASRLSSNGFNETTANAICSHLRAKGVPTAGWKDPIAKSIASGIFGEFKMTPSLTFYQERLARKLLELED